MANVLDTAQRVLAGDGRGGKRKGQGRRPKHPESRRGGAFVIESSVPFDDGVDTLPSPEPKKWHSEANSGLCEALVESSAAILPSMLVTDPETLYALAKAQKEAAMAARAELEYRRKAALVVPREAVQRATATAFATVAQALRSIPDALERKAGVAPEIAERVGIAIDEVLNGLSEDLEQIHKDALAAVREEDENIRERR